MGASNGIFRGAADARNSGWAGFLFVARFAAIQAGAFGLAGCLRAAEPELPADFSGAVLIARGDQILFTRGYGFAHAANREPNTPETRFRIASLTKALTATAILILAGEGKIPLDTPLAAPWPDWPEVWSPITPHALLTHTAGIPDYTARNDFPASWLPRVTAQDVITRLGRLPLASGAGRAPQYSNSHYVLLGALISRVAGESYTDFISARLFGPAAMTGTSILEGRRSADAYATGYTADPTQWEPVDELAPDLLPATGDAASTVGDLHRFIRYVESGVIFGPGGRQRMWAVQAGNQGYGWTATRRQDAIIWVSVGKIRGFSAAMLRAPDESFIAVVLSNRNDAPSLQIGFELLDFARQLPAGAAVPARPGAKK